MHRKQSPSAQAFHLHKENVLEGYQLPGPRLGGWWKKQFKWRRSLFGPKDSDPASRPPFLLLLVPEAAVGALQPLPAPPGGDGAPGWGSRDLR